MRIVLSPAKSLDFATPPTVPDHSQPAFLDQARQLVAELRRRSPAEIAALMGISDKLALLNFNRYAEWSPPFAPHNAKQAVLAFDGDVYDGLAARTLSAADLAFAQEHLRILSGLYGWLRPLDLIQPYRLEMGTRLTNRRGRDLYAFWGDRLAKAARQEGAGGVLVNLASQEYFRALAGGIKGRVIQPVFEDWSGGRYRIVSFFAKRARGLMARYAILNRLTAPEGLQDFDLDGYAYAPAVSDHDRWVFRR
ncbi:MAG: peroxide stress protein YaaA [Dechloromonas sp.]|jgi:cytoplasmic iron level regulating protein YaaA (DUF328/UPF0246 family)|nr:peroxide stress protein YaaA [Dechloromonas sp.]